DIARATKAERINILAPIPGKDTVGIEIANNEKVTVALRELFEDPVFTDPQHKIPIALGKDVYGKTVIGDLAKMPHLLVAGATGAGKSVCINGIIASMLYRFTPDELRFIMIDPKIVEMKGYNNLPHQIVPVVTDSKKVLLALRWVVNEMERRYQLFAKLNLRNFDAFNAREQNKGNGQDEFFDASGQSKLDFDPTKEATKNNNSVEDSEWEYEEVEVEVEVEYEEGEKEGEWQEVNSEGSLENQSDGSKPQTQSDEILANHSEFSKEEHLRNKEIVNSVDSTDEEKIPERLPYIVVIIDELADLMQTAPADVEQAIARIAQKARAAGIHLIIATQTPRADVVTGIIKANIPSRIAFQVSSSLDSRVILDNKGAEKLVGKGDMLYLPPGSAQLQRAQGALITDAECLSIVDFCSEQASPIFAQEIEDSINGKSEESEEISEEDEAVIEKCLEVIQVERRASTSLLQRRLRLGYTRAARMMDILEMRGIIGPGDGAKPREILVDLAN
ncbi:MAG: FtsK/SpoIIIE domain-containing protein, partial [Verrucomicrobiota bacterium]|nr:FtsK/SpoIIIE domain-containing protein [Verrucomicrobiota bacterium]